MAHASVILPISGQTLSLFVRYVTQHVRMVALEAHHQNALSAQMVLIIIFQTLRSVTRFAQQVTQTQLTLGIECWYRI